jgi:hypothetical protein
VPALCQTLSRGVVDCEPAGRVRDEDPNAAADGERHDALPAIPRAARDAEDQESEHPCSDRSPRDGELHLGREQREGACGRDTGPSHHPHGGRDGKAPDQPSPAIRPVAFQ